MVFKRSAAALILIFLCTKPAALFGGQQYEKMIRMAEQALARENYSGAELWYQKARQAKPEMALPALRLGQIFYQTGRYKLSRETFAQAQKLRTDASSKVFLQNAVEKMDSAGEVLGQLERSTGEKDAAGQLEWHIRAFQEMVKPPVFMSLVEPHLDFLLKMEPSNPELLRFLSEGYYSSSDPLKAYQYTKKLVERSSADLALYARYGDTAVNVGNYDEARRAYKKALRLAVGKGVRQEIVKLKKNIKQLPLFMTQIEQKIEAQEYADAFKQLRKRLVRNPVDAWSMIQMARIYEEVNRPWISENIYRQAVRAHPEEPSIRYALGRFYLLKKKNFDKAMAEFQIFRSLLSEYLMAPMEPEERKKIEQSADEVSRYIAYIYLEILKKPKLAEKEMERLVKREKPESRDLYTLGVIYLRNNKKSSAYQVFKKTATLDPDSEWGKEALRILEQS